MITLTLILLLVVGYFVKNGKYWLAYLKNPRYGILPPPIGVLTLLWNVKGEGDMDTCVDI